MSASTLHEQLSDELRELASGLPADTKLPSEDDLMRKFGVSRTTVRRALQTLVDEEILVRHHGRGTFVAVQRPIERLDRMRPFIRSTYDAGRAHAELAHAQWVTGEQIPEELGGPDARALSIRQVYIEGGRARGLLDSLVAASVGQQIRRGDLERYPITHLLQRQLGAELARAELTISYECAPADVAGRLEVPVAGPLLTVRRTTHTRSDRVVEVAHHYLLPGDHWLEVTIEAAKLGPLLDKKGRDPMTSLVQP